MSAPKRRRVEIPLQVKRELVKKKDDNPKMTIAELQHFVKEKFALEMGRSTISDITKDKDKWLAISDNQTGTRLKTVSHADLEESLALWFAYARTQNMVLKDELVIRKAKQIGQELGITDFQYSKGWLAKLKMRHGIKTLKVHGDAASVDMDMIVTEIQKLQDLLKNYNPEDVYSCDKTCLFYKMEPNTTLAQGPVSGKIQSKDRLTVLLITNASGTDKPKPLVIWKYNRPRCFGRLNMGFDPNQICHWYSSKKALMTGAIFSDWLASLDWQMRLLQKKILLLMEYAPSHAIPATLTNVQVLFMPPNTTAHLQPLSAGIVKNFKALYRRQQMRFYLECVGDGKVCDLNLTIALQFVHKAWRDVSQETIQHCWRHTRIMPGMSEDLNAEASNPNDLTGEIQSLIDSAPTFDMSAEQFIDIDKDIDSETALTEEEIVDIGMKHNHEDECDEDTNERDNDNTVMITSKQARECCELLKEYILQNLQDYSMSDLDAILNFKEKMFEVTRKKSTVQRTITSFFKKE